MLKKRPRVLLVSAEAYPFAGSGAGEATMQALPEAMAREGFDVSIILPKYRRPAIEALECATVAERLPVPLGENKIPTAVYRAEAAVSPAVPIDAVVDPESPRRRFPVYFVENVKYFDRERIFGSANVPYLDNDERFTFFCRAVMEFVRKAGTGVDLIHCHDWPTALIPLFLRARYGDLRPFKKTVSVLTVHDPAAQGEFPPESFALTGLAWDLFHPEKLALNGRFNFLNAGFHYADGLSAGNEGTAEAIRTGQFGPVLAAALEKRRCEAAKADFDFTAPASVRDYARIYRHVIQNPRGGSHVR
jgi:starch synthase